jgi:beta-lactamase class A
VAGVARLAVSVCCGLPGAPPAFARAADHPHYAASIIKLAIMLAMYDPEDCGELDLDEPVVVTDRFASLAGGQFQADPGYDNDDEPWLEMGRRVSPRWLCRRMIVSSSNLASNLLLERVGLDAVNRHCPAGMSVRRQIGDIAASESGITNTVTAAACADLLAAVISADRAGSANGAEMLRMLRDGLHRDGIPAALPADACVATKSGWVDGVRHDCAIISGADTAPYVLSVCTTGLADDRALDLIRHIAAASWRDRQQFAASSPTTAQRGATS